MNRQELVNAVAADDGPFSKALADVAVDRVFGAITEALTAGHDVRLLNFGTFTVAERPARDGFNPRTGEKIQIAASKQAKWKPGKRVRDGLNGKGDPA